MAKLYRVCITRNKGKSNWNRTIKWFKSRLDAECEVRNMNLNKPKYKKDYIYIVREIEE